MLELEQTCVLTQCSPPHAIPRPLLAERLNYDDFSCRVFQNYNSNSCNSVLGEAQKMVTTTVVRFEVAATMPHRNNAKEADI